MSFQNLPEGTVTVLFTDAVGSTARTQRLGDEAANALRQAIVELCREQVEKHRGVEVKGTGDGLMLAFQSARRGVRCAQDIQRAVAVRNREHPEEEVLLRIGLHTGEVIQDEEDLFGETVDIASRLEQAAEPASILASSAVHSVLGTARDELEERGEIQLKGIDDAWRIFDVPWAETTLAHAGFQQTPFVGRSAERAKLRELLDVAQSGRGTLALIAGEPGVGKTRLMQELTTDARSMGFLTLDGHCYEQEGAVPYHPFVEMLEMALRIVPHDALRQSLGGSAAEAAKLVPQLRVHFADIPEPIPLPPEQERRFLFTNMAEFVERAAAVQPLLLVWEDLHWADEATLALLRFLADRLESMPVVLLGSYRDTDLSVARPLASFLSDLRRIPGTQRVSLPPLTEDEVGSLVATLSGAAPPAQVLAVLYQETEGVPLFVEEVFRHLQESGRLFDERGAWRNDLAIAEDEVPEGVQLVIGLRLERIAEASRATLTRAAVIGRNFDFGLLEAMEPDAVALLDAIDEAEESHIIRDVSRGQRPTYQFNHELVRQTLLNGLSLPRRQRLHAEVATAIRARTGLVANDAAADLAHHLFQAGLAADPEEAVAALALAAEEASAATAFGEAVTLYEQALSVEGLPDRLGLLRGYARALRKSGRRTEAEAVWSEAVEGYEAAGNGDEVAALCTELGHYLMWDGRVSEVLQAAERGLRAVGKQPTIQRATLLAMRGGSAAYAFERDYASDSADIEAAEEIVRASDDEWALGYVLLNKALLHDVYWIGVGRTEVCAEAVTHLRASGDAYLAVNAEMQAMTGRMELGQFDDLSIDAARLETEARRLGHSGVRLGAGWGRAVGTLIESRDLAQYQALAEESLEESLESGEALIAVERTALGLGLLWSGDWSAAAEQAHLAYDGDGPPIIRAYAIAGLRVGLYANAPDWTKAIDDARRFAPDDQQPHGYDAWESLVNLPEALVWMGELEEAAELYPVLVSFASWTGMRYDYFGHNLVEKVMGLAAAAATRWPEAEEHFRAALRQASDFPHPIEQPEVRRWYAWMLLRRDAPGDQERARQLLGEAIVQYRTIGMPKHVELAQQMLTEA